MFSIFLDGLNLTTSFSGTSTGSPVAGFLAIRAGLNTVQGIEDLGVIRNIGQPELRIELNERQLARYGVAKEDVQSIIEMAIGGKSASLLYEDERKFNIMVRTFG